MRFYAYEPETPRPALDPHGASYQEGYRTAAAFLAWLSATRDPESVAGLNARMRRGGCTPRAFDARFGAGLDELWALSAPPERRSIRRLARRRRAPRPPTGYARDRARAAVRRRPRADGPVA